MVSGSGWRWIVVALLGAAGCAAEGTVVAATRTPQVVEVDAGERRELGSWDDVLPLEAQGTLILRRDAELYSLALGSECDPSLVAEVPQARGSRMRFAVAGVDEAWVFLESDTHAPFAVGLDSHARLSFEVPGLPSPPHRPPLIQSWVVSADGGSALLMISGSESNELWPRPGNRPVYFWVSMEGKRSVQLPVGWDLSYFAADQSVAVFDAPQEERFQRRPLRGVDMRTGEGLSPVPDRRQQPFIPFIWTNTDLAKPLFAPRRVETGDRDSLVGVAARGRAVPLQLSVDSPYTPTVKASDSWAAVHIRGHGSPRQEDHSLWLARLEESVEPVLVDTEVQDFELLGPGICLFTQGGHGGKQTLSEAFVYDAGTQLRSNVLDGIERLPPLEPELAARSYIADRMTVRLIQGLGSPGTDPLVLALFSHYRADERAHTGPVASPDVAMELWSATVLVSARGVRHVPGLFHDRAQPDLIYLHNSGALLVGELEWSGEADRRVRRVRLAAIELDL